MAICMSFAKMRKVAGEYRRRLGKGWEFVEDKHRLYNAGAVIAVRGDLKAVLDMGRAPYLRVSVGQSMDDIIELPNIEAERLGKLAADIASACSRAREEA